MGVSAAGAWTEDSEVMGCLVFYVLGASFGSFLAASMRWKYIARKHKIGRMFIFFPARPQTDQGRILSSPENR
jgi:hypothetical protein